MSSTATISSSLAAPTRGSTAQSPGHGTTVIPTAYNYFADQNKEFVQRRRTTRYDECFRKLPDEFKTQQFKDCFNTNDSATSRALKRLKADGLIEKLSYGAYRKLVQELP